MEKVRQSWAKQSDLEKYKELNKKFGYETAPDNSKWSRRWEYAWTKEFLDTLPEKNVKLLDVGSTPVLMMKELMKPEWEVHSCDVNDAPVYKPYGKFHVCDIKNSGFENDSFDVVMSISTIEHDKEALKCVEEMKRITKPGGHLVITFDYNSDKDPIMRNKINIFDKDVERLCESLEVEVIQKPHDIILSEQCSGFNGLRVMGVVVKK